MQPYVVVTVNGIATVLIGNIGYTNVIIPQDNVHNSNNYTRNTHAKYVSRGTPKEGNDEVSHHSQSREQLPRRPGERGEGRGERGEGRGGGERQYHVQRE